MGHIHTLTPDVPRSSRVFCDGCDISLRLATHDEAWYVHNISGPVNGAMVWESNIIVVPVDFSIFQEV